MRTSGKNMIAVASNKRGVGKTWFSVTLTHALNGLKQKSLFFDGDLGLGNIDLQLGLAPQYGLGAVINGYLTLNQIIYHCDKTHFDFIADRSGVASLSTMPIGRLQILGEDLSIVSSSYDRVILDMGAGMDKSVRVLSGMTDKVIVVCNDEPSSLSETYAFIKMMNNDYPKSELMIVVNQANTLQEGHRTYNTLIKACQEFLNFTPALLGVIRQDTRIRDAIRSQVPFISRYPMSEAAEDVINIARKLIS